MTKLLGTTEAARRIEVSVPTLHKWYREGRIQPEVVTDSQRLLFTASEVERVRQAWAERAR